MSGMFQNSNLTGEIVAEGSLEGEIVARKSLEGSIWKPKEVEVVKYANAPQIDTVTLLASDWIGEDKLYYQIVEIESVTESSQVDLTPDVQQLMVFYEKDLTFVTKNENGVVTVFAIGQKPLNDYCIQVTLTGVNVPAGTIIWGVTVGTPISTEKLAENLEDFSPLPIITENDNGKVLKAQGGKWTVQDDATAKALSNLEIEELIENCK